MTESDRKKKAKLIHEVVKGQHTSHWDLDYLSREELEKLMALNEPPRDSDQAATPDPGDEESGSSEAGKGP